MKNRFNWVFELLEAKVHSAGSDYSRGAAPGRNGAMLTESLRRVLDEARERKEEFRDHAQYVLFLDEFIDAVQAFLDGPGGGEDIEGRLEKLESAVTRLDDNIRAALK